MRIHASTAGCCPLLCLHIRINVFTYIHVHLCRVLGPYLKGGGAKSLDFQSLSQDLIRTSMQIPFSVPPYMSLLARSTATLEGIALMGDPNYQMVSQVC